ncbi:hypothetical protein AAFC00_001562 [Neodothiora populina]|uniref:DUF7918 domain-containing protein n=1 Tax=Neodothiora populina TaxID=2781224 RepID=A0ABR3PPH5_9PEZI
MPCFQGLAVSIHTPDGPITEYSIQKQQKFGRITSYIPVPATPQQSTFAVSITLLTPGLKVPYSAAKPSAENPYPQPMVVGGLPTTGSTRGQYQNTVKPYIPHTSSPNETVAAYIYFDGRQKEEVATLLRKGEETWVNSRWVSIPESEGGGIAEREFLFREVGLERWLNGLDLSAGADKARKIEKRQQKLQRRANEAIKQQDDDSSDDDDDDEPPEPEASGQIKVALFRVLASGEIKRGEYSPQFDVHDDEGVDGSGQTAAGEDVDHTTSFAKPKSLDPKSISTQTVTGLDPPDQPFAVFTFFYRGEKQLQKMGILPDPDATVPTPAASKKQIDFSKLGPLKNTGTKGFSSYRNDDNTDMESDNDDDSDAEKNDKDELDDAPVTATTGKMSEEEIKVAEGVRKIKLKRQHSTDVSLQQMNKESPTQQHQQQQPPLEPPSSVSASASATEKPLSSSDHLNIETPDTIASPFKKHRPSNSGLEVPGAIYAGLNLNSLVNAKAPGEAQAEQGEEEDEEL